MQASHATFPHDQLAAVAPPRPRQARHGNCCKPCRCGDHHQHAEESRETSDKRRHLQIQSSCAQQPSGLLLAAGNGDGGQRGGMHRQKGRTTAMAACWPQAGSLLATGHGSLLATCAHRLPEPWAEAASCERNNAGQQQVTIELQRSTTRPPHALNDRLEKQRQRSSGPAQRGGAARQRGAQHGPLWCHEAGRSAETRCRPHQSPRQ